MTFPVPWLAAQGAWIWRGALVVMVAAAALVAWRRHRGRVRRHLVEALASLGSPGTPDAGDGTTVTLSGTLLERGRMLRVGSVDVALEGPLEVLAGSQEWLQAGRTVRRVTDGDQVRVAGVLDSVPSQSGSEDYRATAARRVLRGNTTLRIASERPSRDGWRILWPLTTGGVLGGLAFLLLFGLGGKLLMIGVSGLERDQMPGERGGWCYRSPPLGRATLATATPFHRKAALNRLRWFNEESCQVGSDSVRRMIGIDLAQGNCAGAAYELAQRWQSRHAMALADSCGATHTSALSRVRLGDLAGASAVLERDPKTNHYLAASTHLLAGRFALAARAIEVRVLEAEAKPGTEKWALRQAAKLRCLVAALDYRSGVTAARAELERGLAGHAPAECAVLLADVLPAGERKAVLEPVLDHRDDAAMSWNVPERELVCLLLIEGQPDHPCGSADFMRFDHDSFDRDVPRWFGHMGEDFWGVRQAVLPVLRGSTAPFAPTLIARNELKLGGLALVTGASVQAQEHVMRALATPAGPEWRESALTFAAVIELDAGFPDRALALVGTAKGYYPRQLASTAQVLLGQRPLPEDHAFLYFISDRAAWAAAIAGDGAALLAVTRASMLPDRDALLVGARRAKSGQAELADWIAWGDDGDSTLLNETDLALRLGARGRALAALGDPQAKDLLTGAAAIRTALLARDSSVPLFFLEN